MATYGTEKECLVVGSLTGIHAGGKLVRQRNGLGHVGQFSVTPEDFQETSKIPLSHVSAPQSAKC
jgi:hypothetical protein